jgi:outer membrane immunogenic protein
MLEFGRQLMMKPLVAGLAGLLLASSAVHAADIMAPASYNWTDFYIGAQIGGAWDNENMTLAPNGSAAYNTTQVNSSGLVGGLNAGHNWQTNNFVFGLEGDIEAKGIDNSYDIGSPFANTTGTTKSDFQGSLRARAGFAMDRTLVYATGGVTLADF